MHYYILSLGCQMNQVDAQRLEKVLQKMGYLPTLEEEKADILGIMACSVRQKAIDKVYHKIKVWNEWRKKRNIITFVSGCVLPEDEIKFLKKFDFVFRLNDIDKVPDMLKNYGMVTASSLAFNSLESPYEEQVNQVDSFWKVKPIFKSKFEAYIPIQNGCDKFCTFCAVPYTRGREISRPFDDIVQEIEDLVLKGYKIFTLLGQNVNSYGLDRSSMLRHPFKKRKGFQELLAAIGEIGNRLGKEFWVYFTAPHPRDMTDDIYLTMARYPVLAKWIHLPMQSGNDKVLMRMNRNHSMKRYDALVNSFRKILPQATLFTDIIVGFSGETEEQFHDTYLAMEKYHFNMAYIAQYSPRPGATSYKWEDSVTIQDKKKRFQSLTTVLKKYSLLYNQNQLGKTKRVFIEKYSDKDNYLYGRSEGKLIIRCRLPSHLKIEECVGQFVNIRVDLASDLSLEGTWIN